MNGRRKVGNINVHTQSVSIQPVPEFNPGSEVGASLAKRWNTWIANFQIFITARGIQDKKQKRALLFYQAGSRVREISRQLADTGTNEDYDILKAKLKEYFEPQKDRKYEVFKFHEVKQEPIETLDQLKSDRAQEIYRGDETLTTMPLLWWTIPT